MQGVEARGTPKARSERDIETKENRNNASKAALDMDWRGHSVLAT